MKNKRGGRDSPAGQGLGLSAFPAMAQVQSLVMELRSCKLFIVAKKKKKNEWMLVPWDYEFFYFWLCLPCQRLVGPKQIFLEWMNMDFFFKLLIFP